MLKLLLVLGVVVFLLRLLYLKSSSAPSNTPPPPRSSSLTAAEAREILGVSSDASDEEIHAAHRRMMKHLHPDNGGSHYFATRLNMARDLLLAKK